MAAEAPESTNALACYGDLRPGEKAHYLVGRISGEWTTGTTLGWVFETTWGPASGWPGFTSDAAGQPVRVDVLISPDLLRQWATIDREQGDGYRRRIVEVTLEDGRRIAASIYETASDVPDEPERD